MKLLLTKGIRMPLIVRSVRKVVKRTGVLLGGNRSGLIKRMEIS